jgi:hypothetical protein
MLQMNSFTCRLGIEICKYVGLVVVVVVVVGVVVDIVGEPGLNMGRMEFWGKWWGEYS